MEDSGFVEVCVILEGFIEREVVIPVFTVDKSATGNTKIIVIILTELTGFFFCRPRGLFTN